MHGRMKMVSYSFKRSIIVFTLVLAILMSCFQVVSAASDEVWNAIDTSPIVVPNSALDLSFMNDAPAGKHGFIDIDADGDYYFQNEPGKKVRFYGANLISAGLFGTNEQAVAIADRMTKMGYNVIRIHAHDWMYSWGQGIFNKPTSTDVELNIEKLDRLEYLIYQLKQRGIYVKIDGTTFFDMAQVPGLGSYMNSEMATNYLIQLMPTAYDVWQSAMEKWFTHTNPYTGMALKDDPVLIGVSPWNEGILANMNLSQYYFEPELKDWLLTDFNEFLTNNGRQTVESFPVAYWSVGGAVQNSLAEYITLKTLNAYDKMKAYLKNDLGIKAPIGGMNMGDAPLQGYWRTHADAYETHMYHALVQTRFNDANGKGFVYDPLKFPRLSQTFSQETMDTYPKAWDTDSQFFYYYPTLSLRQQYNKPFELTEYNDGIPVKGREEIGIIATAAGAYHNWDVMNRFEYGGESDISDILDNVPYANNWLSMTGDPLGILSEIESTLLFRGNVLTASRPTFVIVRDSTWSHTTGQANQFVENVLNMSYIPHLFNTQTVFADKPGQPYAIYKITPELTSAQIESGDIPEGNKIGITDSMTFKEAAEVMINALDDTALKEKMLSYLNQNKLISDTGELVFDLNLNTYLVNTPKAIAAAGVLDNNTFNFDQGSIKGDVDKGTFFAASLDENALSDSNRILAIYTTDVKATGEQFVPQTDGTVKYYSGTLPTLAKMNSVQFDLKTTRRAEGFKAYKLGMNGERLAELPVRSNENGIGVQMSTDKGYAFEIVYSPLFTDDFEQGNINNWEDVNGSGSWSIVSDENGNHDYYNSNGTSGGLKLVAGLSSWTDYSVSADMRVDAWNNGEAGLIARYVDPRNYYYLSHNSQWTIWQICRMKDGEQTVLEASWKPTSPTIGENHRVLFEVNGSVLSATVDGEQIISITDPTFTSGKLGLYAHMQKVSFDNVFATESVPLDTLAPVITVGGVVEGGTYMDSVTPVVSAEDQSSGLKSLKVTVDGQEWTTGAAIDVVGNHILVAEAEDNVGNIATTTVNFVITDIEFTIGTVQFTKLDGEVITELPTSGFVNAGVTLTNITQSAQQATLIVALYDAGGEIQNLSCIKKIVGAGITEDFTAGFNLPVSHKDYVIKVMVWDNLANQGAMSNVVTLQ